MNPRGPVTWPEVTVVLGWRVDEGVDVGGIMEDIGSIHLKRLHGRLGDVVYQLTRVQFSRFSAPESWRPSINAYRCTDCMIVCVDLAGVDRDALDVQV